MVKIEIKYPYPQWKKGIRSGWGRLVSYTAYCDENVMRIVDCVSKFQVENVTTIAFQDGMKDNTITLFVEDDNLAIKIADTIRNIRVAMLTDKRMSARIVK